MISFCAKIESVFDKQTNECGKRMRLGKYKFPIKIRKKTQKEKEKQVSGSSLGKVRTNPINYFECSFDPHDNTLTNVTYMYILCVPRYFNGFVCPIRAPQGKSINRKSTLEIQASQSICVPKKRVAVNFHFL